jgi:hypothetical protein
MALTPFEQEFKSQRELLGPGKTFTFKGKEYSTDYAKPKTTSNRGGARMKSGTDVMDTLPKVGKVDRSELEDYDITPKQKIGFKAEDMGMGQYSMPKGSSFIPGKTDKPQSKLPGRFPTKEQSAIEPADKSDTRTIPQKISESLYPEGAYKLKDMKFTGEKPVSKAKGGLVKAKRTSHRGAGIATKGFGRAGGR